MVLCVSDKRSNIVWQQQRIGKDLGSRETGNVSKTIVYYFEYWYSLELGYSLGASLNLLEVGVD